MVFSSLTFIYLFLPIVLILYFISPMKIKNLIIFISGILFYAWGEPICVLIMLLSTVIDYTAGIFMHKFDDNQKKRTICLIVSVVMNVGLLAIFKYSDFIIDSVNALFNLEILNPVVRLNKSLNSVFDLGLNEQRVDLPIGISFFTFQSMSYTIDLYRRNIKVQKSFINFSSYVSLFPQIVAGPIVRYEDVQKEIDTRKINVSMGADGIAIFVKGLSKKVLLANNIGMLWTSVKAMDYSEISVVTAWLGILAFTFQIYFDFSGYSDMAVGLGKILGFNFPQNFDHPYMSKSVSEFWRRWHMTLGNWFKSYVYISLGGNRKGFHRTLINLIIVWALTGLWHGSSWNFVIWGMYFGVIIIIERIGFGKILEKLPAFVSTLYTFVLVVFGWVLFDTTDLPACFSYLKAMFGGNGIIIDGNAKYFIVTNMLIFALCIFGSTDLFGKILSKIRSKNNSLVEWSAPFIQVVLMLVCTSFLVNATYNPFLYFRF
ncbi:MAG: MBOAT family protein [Oscillospiraceae bacterium]|nr:MBOAT family protein [Oscillospiraceae bacterium]